MKLNDLAQHLGQGVIGQEAFDHNGLLPFLGVSHDSRQVNVGNIFIVIPCDQAEAHVRSALKAGAVALIAESDFVEMMRDKLGMPILTVASSRRALSQSAAFLYPGQPETTVAVTGTNGKSSVVTYVRQIWQKLGYAASSLGTLGVDLSYQAKVKSDLPITKLTTPDALIFHEMLNTLSESNVTHCAFEASSHGLNQYRLHGVRLAAAGFTNLSQDHLDYHETMDAYFEAKAKLFMEVLGADKTAVLNAASTYFPAIKSYGLGAGADHYFLWRGSGG